MIRSVDITHKSVETQAIEREDLAGFLIRLSQQPGRKACDLVLMGRTGIKPDGGKYLVMGVSCWVWWN